MNLCAKIISICCNVLGLNECLANYNMIKNAYGMQGYYFFPC